MLIYKEHCIAIPAQILSMVVVRLLQIYNPQKGKQDDFNSVSCISRLVVCTHGQ